MYSEENRYSLINSFDVRYPHIKWINTRWLFSHVVTNCYENIVSMEAGLLF